MAYHFHSSSTKRNTQRRHCCRNKRGGTEGAVQIKHDSGTQMTPKAAQKVLQLDRKSVDSICKPLEWNHHLPNEKYTDDGQRGTRRSICIELIWRFDKMKTQWVGKKTIKGQSQDTTIRLNSRRVLLNPDMNSCTRPKDIKWLFGLRACLRIEQTSQTNKITKIMNFWHVLFYGQNSDNDIAQSPRVCGRNHLLRYLTQ